MCPLRPEIAEIAAGEQKYYLADLGFYFALNTDNRINYGPVLENIVYRYARAGLQGQRRSHREAGMRLHPQNPRDGLCIHSSKL